MKFSAFTRFLMASLAICSAILPSVAKDISASANLRVTGTVFDADADEPCPNAVYHIYEAPDTLRPLINNITDLEGHFDQPLPRAGEYLLTIEYPGLKTSAREFKVSNAAPVADLGNLQLYRESATLQEVVVSVKKPVVVSDGANLTYNADQDPASANSSLLELLRRVPMVTVDGQDNIRVNGSSDFKILLNGRSNPMFNSDPQQVLKAMPASGIAKIEVLTEPGAKYDAEGTGGILNIITQTGTNSKMENGYAGHVSTGLAVRGWDIDGMLRMKHNRVTASASVNYMNGHLFHRANDNSMLTEYTDGSKRETSIKMPLGNNFDYLSGDVSLSWEPNSLNLFTLSLNTQRVGATQQMYPAISSFYNADGTLTSHTLEDMMVHFSTPSWSVNTSYQHNFDNAGNALTLSYQYAYNKTAYTLDQTVQDLLTPDSPVVPGFTDNKSAANEHTAQADWSKPLGATQLLEVGAKGVFRHNRGITDIYAPDLAGTLALDPLSSTDLTQYQDIVAAYTSYTGHFGAWTLRGGLRYEYTHMGINFHKGDYKDFSNVLNDIVPDAAISYSLSPMKTLRLAYNMRISRPTVDQVNPAQIEVIPGLINTGNPDLSSQKIHQMSLAYSSFAGSMSFNARASYSLTDNMISNYTYVKDGLLYSSSANLGRQHKFNLDGFINWNVTSRLQVGMNANLGWLTHRLPMDEPTTHGWQGNLGANLSYTAPGDIRLSAYGGWASKQYNAQGWFNGWHYYGLGISKNFLKDKLEVTLTAQNMFEDRTSFHNTSITSQSITRTTFHNKNWDVGIKLKWNFGHLKSQVKKTNATIDNTDAVKTSNSQNGSSF